MFDKHWTLDPVGWEQTGTIIQHMHGLMMDGGKLLPPTENFKPTTPPPPAD